MKLARVTGTVVSTINAEVFDDRRLLICDLITPQGSATGNYTIAVDTVDAGPGETVLILDEGNSARQVLAEPDGCVRAVIVGIIDDLEIADSSDA